MFQMSFPLQPQQLSPSGISDCQISDTVSESSDNATLLSLSREDLTALGAGQIREDVRVSRKKLEALILQERDEAPEKGFMETLMGGTNTYIQWPSRMKIGAKTKKDLFVRIYGHNQDEVNNAKTQVLQELGPHRDLRITLKMEISYTDHSHLIGCRGATIRKVMEDTGCHIHFPDSNRMSKDHKSNQVTIAGGSLQAVEQARARVRELSPLILQFNLPMMHTSYDMHVNPDAHHVFIDTIQSTHNVQVTIHPPNKLQQTTVSVKGCEIDSARIKEAVGKIINYFAAGTHMGSVTVESTMEISAVQHGFVRAVNDSNVHSIMINTGAKIIFPDLSDNNIQQIKRSRIFIAGDINSVYFARQQLIGCLPLRMIFDLADDYQLDWEAVRSIGSDLNVNVKLINRNSRMLSGGPGSSLPPPIPGRSRTIQLIAAERNTGNIYEARRLILGGQESPPIANIPLTYSLRSVFPQSGNRLHTPGPLPPLLLPSSPSMVSPVLSPSFWPPTPFTSPFCSPPISTCVLPTGPPPMMDNNGPPGFGNIRPRHFNPSPMHQQFQPRYGGGLLRDNDRISEQETPPPPGMPSKYPTNGPYKIPDTRDFQHPRKAPGYERSNTNPHILVSPPESTIESESSEGKAPSSTSINSMNEKKLLAMKAMYQAKIGSSPRVPTSEWSGCGFSKTHMSLFPVKETSQDQGEGKNSGTPEEGSPPSTSGNNNGWPNSPESDDSNNNNTNGSQNDTSAVAVPPPKTPLGAQQSNLLECSSTTLALAEFLNDLPTLLIQNGLGKYIDLFIAEEIDLSCFSTLTEEDLRSLGVTSYPSRKKMLIIISQLASRGWK